MTATSTAILKSNKRTALFAGSFNPFTAGHADIVARGLELFDRIVIGIGVNASKPDGGDNDRLAAVAELYAAEPRVEVRTFSGLTVDFASVVGADVLLRGVRSVKDFEYERDMADINMRLSGIDTVLLFSRPELAAVSSSLVRELQAYGADVSQFLPKRF